MNVFSKEIFSKENYDVSQMFLAYLTFLGNTTKVSIALDVPVQVVEVLAAKEDWPAKLKVYSGLRHEEQLPEDEKAIRRTVNLIQARHLQDILKRVIDQMHEKADAHEVIEWMSPRNPRTNQPTF